MNYDGAPPLATPDEQARVLALAAEGKSQRAIAQAVFGDVRLKDRVRRILDRTRRAASAPDADALARLEAELADLLTGEDPSLEVLVRAYKLRLVARLKDPRVRVSPSELTALLPLERHLAAEATLRRLNELTRAPRRARRPSS